MAPIQFAAPGSDKGIEKPVNAIMLQGEKIDSEKLNQLFKNTETVTKVQPSRVCLVIKKKMARL